jgi:predicted membrane protein
MVELLKSLYEQNEIYHEVKERMAWQAFAIYLAFSLFFMNWLYANIRSLTIYPKWQLFLAIFGAVVPAIGFIQRQIYLKALSVEKSGRYMQFMREHPDPSEK